jgi:hypothetical protein
LKHVGAQDEKCIDEGIGVLGATYELGHLNLLEHISLYYKDNLALKVFTGFLHGIDLDFFSYAVVSTI